MGTYKRDFFAMCFWIILLGVLIVGATVIITSSCASANSVVISKEYTPPCTLPLIQETVNGVMTTEVAFPGLWVIVVKTNKGNIETFAVDENVFLSVDCGDKF